MGVPEVVHAVPYILLYAEIGVSGGEERNGGTLALLGAVDKQDAPFGLLDTCNASDSGAITKDTPHRQFMPRS